MHSTSDEKWTKSKFVKFLPLLAVALMLAGCGGGEEAETASGGGDVEKPDPIFVAAEEGDAEEVQRLIDEGADPNYTAPVRYNEQTPLHRAAEEGHADVVEVLLEAGADPNLGSRGRQPGDQAGERPLTLAAEHPEVLKLLVDAGAEVDHAISKMSPAGPTPALTPLHKAATAGNVESVRVLLDADADIENLDGETGTPLFFAASQGHTDVVALLIERGANVDSTTSDGRTPLISAAIYGNTEVVEQLLEAGADKTATTTAHNPLASEPPSPDSEPEPKTAADMARMNGHDDIVAILEGN